MKDKLYIGTITIRCKNFKEIAAFLQDDFSGFFQFYPKASSFEGARVFLEKTQAFCTFRSKKFSNRPAVRALSKKFPNARITYFVSDLAGTNRETVYKNGQKIKEGRI